MKNLEISWIAIAVPLTTASQLRSESFPIGPGEIMILIWMLSVGIRSTNPRYYMITSTVRGVFLFWIVSFIALNVGFLIAESKEISSSSFLHDALAFMLGFLFSMAFAISRISKKEIQKILLISITFTIFCLFILRFLAFLVPFVEPWYAGVRFSGWSKDPNQLAFLLSTFPFFSIHCLSQCNSNAKKFWCILLIMGSLLFGMDTQTDSLKICWILGFILLVLFETHKSVANYINHSISIKKFIFNQITFILILLLVSGLGYFFSKEISSAISEMYNEGSQGETRLKLWFNGIEAAYNSPLFGLGPGAHSGLTAPLSDFEAHNTFIDWASSSGLIGLTSYIAFTFWVGCKAWLRGYMALVAALIALIIYSSFIYVLRHILFWFYLISIVKLCSQSSDSKGI
jgi:O-antigen ligase